MAVVAYPPRVGRVAAEVDCVACRGVTLAAVLRGSLVPAVLAAVAVSTGFDVSSTFSRFFSVRGSFVGVKFASVSDIDGSLIEGVTGCWVSTGGALVVSDVAWLVGASVAVDFSFGAAALGFVGAT